MNNPTTKGNEMKKLTRDETEHGQHYYLASEVEASLAQPVQEPVAHVYLFDHKGKPRVAWHNAKGIKIGDKLYTASTAVQPEQETKIGCIQHDCDECKARLAQIADK